MADIKWIKITTDIFDDEKVLLIESLPDGDALIVIWFKLLCLAGKQNNNGVFMINDRIAFTEEMLATIFRRPLPVVRFAIETFEAYGMIETIDGVITIPNWDKHQNVDGMEKIREQNRERVQRFREKQKLLGCNVTETLHVTQCNAIDKEEDKDKEKDKRIRFTPPTLEQVRDYCNERGNRIDPQRFVDYYSSQNWKKSNGQKVVDWKACIRQWEQREKKDKFNDFSQRSYDYEDLAERLINK